jgi:SAM-dependent methyltransferase
MELTRTQQFMAAVFLLMCIHYLIQVVIDKYALYESPDVTESFEGTGKLSESSSLYTWMTDPQGIYDDFYAGVYDQLTQQAARSKAKVALLMSIWNQKNSTLKPEQWSVLDIGCGTGHSVCAFAEQNVGRIVGMDYSPAMIRYAKDKVQPAAKLTEKQNEAIEWRVETILNPSAAAASEFTHAYCFYFTLYYLENHEEFFRHVNMWTKPGGKFCVEVVNKHKFDPLLESASPFVGFSLQKYSKERLRKSKVAFDKFDYEGEFVLTDPKAEFYETFRYKNGHVRRQKHIFKMPDIREVVECGKRAGWKYIGFQDLNPIGFEYGYLLNFEK